ncbi:MAG: hypothetical protein AAF393_09630 [Pseudomonadota bacterium]
MATMEELEARFDQALAAIGKGGGDTDALTQRVGELEKALSVATETATKSDKKLKSANKELASLREEAEDQDKFDEEEMAALNRRIENLTKAQEDAYEDRNRAKQYNQHVRKLNADLRKANEANVADADAINKSLEAEVEQLSAQREQDLREINDLIAQLRPLVEGEQNG